MWLWDFDARPITNTDLESLKGLARNSRKGFGESILYKTDEFLELSPSEMFPPLSLRMGRSVFSSPIALCGSSLGWQGARDVRRIDMK